MPMIDLDARLNSFQTDLLGSKIGFDEQSLYYQSKSILEVTTTLIKEGAADLKIVGYMILVFSIVFMFGYLTATCRCCLVEPLCLGYRLFLP